MHIKRPRTTKFFGLVATALSTAIYAPIPASAAEAAATKPTFNKDIAPLVFDRCAGCHRPGEVAPFSLLTYRDVSKRAKQIQQVVADQIMPPWKPVPGHGDFSNGRRLTADEVARIRQWAADGAPEGNPADLPPQPVFASGWQLGEPDLIVSMPESTEIPASGPDVYLNLILPLKVPAGKYIKAVEFRPGNRRIVHHAVLFYDTSGRARQLDEADPRPGFSAFTPPGRFMPGTLAIWTPGRNPLPLADGLSMPWPDNADLVLNLHMHPSGKPETEQSSIGFHFTSDPPQRTLLDLMLIDRNIDIAPGDKAYRTKDSAVLPMDAKVLSIFPHMHTIGKKIEVTATLPDGSTKPLFLIDDWDFNWQDLYQYREPVFLPKGTRVTLEAVHDNSADNPHNPKSPPERVRWGEQTFNEMSIAFLNLTPADDSDLPLLAGQSRGRLQVAIVPAGSKLAVGGPKPGAKMAGDAKPPGAEDVNLFAVAAMRKLDKDGNGKLNLDEITAALAGRESAAEIEKRLTQFDVDGDKQLDTTELAAAIKALGRR